MDVFYTANANADTATNTNADTNADTNTATAMTIFVNIASYNDRQLYNTLASCWQNSEFPDRVFFGVCWQSDEPLTVTHPNLFVRWLPLKAARGVGFARSIAHDFYDGQDYYLTIDAHTLFSKSWDSLLVSDFLNYQKKLSKIVYSNYLPGWSEYPYGVSKKLQPKSEFNSYGVLRFIATSKLTEHLIYPPISCHFMFSNSQFFMDLPHDPHIFYNGEEICYTVRAFTHGWDNVQPSKAWLYHKYNQANGHPTVWQNNPNWFLLNQPSIDRVKRICSHSPDGLGKYGKGTKRSLKELEEILNVDFANQIVRLSPPIK